MKLLDLTGMKFGRLIVIVRASNMARPVHWVCQCSCGRRSLVRGDHLRGGDTRSCGCLEREARGRSQRRHGMGQSPEYAAWTQMKQRCGNPKSPKFKNYGGRGIQVCKRWAESFEAFLTEIGRRPSTRHSVDRIDNNRGYEPGNVRWATPAEQSCNRRPRERG